MSHANLPATSPDKSIAPQPQGTLARAWHVRVKPFLKSGTGKISVILATDPIWRPLSKKLYNAIDAWGNLQMIYDFLPTLVSFFKSTWGSITVMLCGFALMALQLFRQEKRLQRPSDIVEGEQSQSMNELIREAARDIEKAPCGMGWLHAIAENDRTNIQNAVQVRAISLLNLMDDAIPKLEFVFTVYNKSLYHISVEWKDGYIRFGREQKLKKNNLEMKENHVVNCPPRRSASFTLEQTLLDSEVRLITSQFDDKEFWLDELVVMIDGGSLSPDVAPQRLKIEGQVSLKHQVWRNYND